MSSTTKIEMISVFSKLFKNNFRDCRNAYPKRLSDVSIRKNNEIKETVA